MIGKQRTTPAMLLIALGTFALLLRQAWLQVEEHEIWAEQAARLERSGELIPYRRGSIQDAGGRILVHDIEAYHLDFSYRAFRREHALGQAAHGASVLLLEPVPLTASLEHAASWARVLVDLTPGDLQDLIDVDAWLRNIALDMVIPDYDGMMGNHKNHALYDHPTRGILPIAYDKDLAFVDLGNYRFGLCSGSIWGGNPCWSSRRSPPILAEYLLARYPEPYLARIRELIDGPLAPETLLPWVEERADALRPWVAADRYYQPDGPACDFDPEFCQWYTPGAWEYEILSIGFNVEARIEEVERQLNGEFLCSKSCRDPPHPWVDEGL